MNTMMDFGNTVMTSMAGAMGVFFASIPRVVGFLIILFIGWFIAALIGKALAAFLHAVKFNNLAEKSGLAEFVRKMGVKADASEFLGQLIKWFIRLIVLVVAFDELGLPAVSAVLTHFLLWLPNLIVALVVLVLGGLAAQALQKLVRGAAAEAKFDKPEMVAAIAKTAVWVFTIVIAVNQLGIAVTLINTLFMGSVGAMSLALGLAFGLGGKETASKIIGNWYANRAALATKIETSQELLEHASQKT